MALFKISKGSGDLPQQPHEGWAYVKKTSEDSGDFYVDYDDNTRIKINAYADFATKLVDAPTLSWKDGQQTGTLNLQLVVGGHTLTAINASYLSNRLVDSVVTKEVITSLTTEWVDTGIKSTDLATGTHIVQVCNNGRSVTGFYDEYWSGVMSWYSGSTNATMGEEIVLHQIGQGSGGKNIYLRTVRTPSSDTDNLKLQISASTTIPSSTYTIKFRKII